MIRKISIPFLFILLLCSGCGGGASDTNGTLALTVTSTDRTGGVFTIDENAIYTPPAGKVANGVAITLTTSVHTLNGTPVATIPSANLRADQAGLVSQSYNIPQANGPIYVDVTAFTGGLSIFRSVTIPSLVTLTTSPSTVAFAANASAGTQQSVTVSGGTSPYSASMDTAHAGDMLINVNGATITLTKRNNSGQAAILGAQLTISDNNGNSVTIPVGYN